MTRTTRRLPGVAAATIVLLLAGCSSAAPEDAAPDAASSPSPTPEAPTAAAPTPASTPSRAPAATVPTIPGYAVGDFPAVPLFALPDLALLDRSASAFTIEVGAELDDIDGVVVSPAHCDEAGVVASSGGTATLYGDGSGSYVLPDGEVSNYGDGSGTSTINGVTITNYGDGSGSYDDGVVRIDNYGDGSGAYEDADIHVQIYGDGSGSYADGETRIDNYGDGSGAYTDGVVSIENYGDGSGAYADGEITVQNYGDGTGAVNGVAIEVDPIAPVPTLGVFPPIGALEPLESCGTTISFEDGVLFDFDSSEIRDDAAEALETVARVLEEAQLPEAVVSGHTDAIGDDADNQALSEARAEAVVAALSGAGVGTALTAEGWGESRPVAANEIDGVDNPAGRQLNRRVEIFLPAVL